VSVKRVYGRKRADKGMTLVEFGPLGQLMVPKSDKARLSMARRYSHRSYIGPLSGRTIYLPKRLFNAFMALLRKIQREQHIPYVYAYEEVAKLLERG